MKKGDHICVKHPHPMVGDLVIHHGIYCGDGTVIHFDGHGKLSGKAKIRRDNLERFCEPFPVSEILVFEQCPSGSADEVVQKAESLIGQSGYDFFGKNCEHFVSYCKTGEWKSKQVDNANKEVVKTKKTVTSSAIARGIGLPNILRTVGKVAQRDPAQAVFLGLGLVVAGAVTATVSTVSSYTVKKFSEMDSLRKSQPPEK